MGKNFYFLWLSISCSKLASSLYTMTVTLIVYNLTKSATLASVIMLTYVLGKLASSLCLPILNKCLSVNQLLFRGLLLQLLLILLYFLVLNFNNVLPALGYLVIIYTVTLSIGFSDGIISPSRNSLIPDVVKRESLEKANGLIGTVDQTLSLLGWALGALLINIFGSSFMILSIVILIIFAAVSSYLIFVPVKKQAMEKSNNIELIKLGWKLLFDKKSNLILITTMDILEGIASSIWIGGITLVFVQSVLHKSEEWWGYINAGYFIGSIVGGLLITLYSKKISKNLIKNIIFSSFTVSLLVLIYSLNSNAYIALLLVVLMGPFYQMRDISQQSFIQKNISSTELINLYIAKDNMYYIIFALSVFVSGFISDFFGVVYVYYLAFSLYLISSITGVFLLRKSRNINKKVRSI